MVKFFKNRRGMEIEQLAIILIAVAVLIILVGGSIYLKSKGISVLGYIKDLFKFGRR